MSVPVQAKEIPHDATLSRLRPVVAFQRQQIATLTPKLGSGDVARRLADEINREGGALVQTLNGAPRLSVKTAEGPAAAEVVFRTKLKNHEEHLRRLEVQLGSLTPCVPTAPPGGLSRLTSTGR